MDDLCVCTEFSGNTGVINYIACGGLSLLICGQGQAVEADRAQKLQIAT